MAGLGWRVELALQQRRQGRADPGQIGELVDDSDQRALFAEAEQVTNRDRPIGQA